MNSFFVLANCFILIYDSREAADSVFTVERRTGKCKIKKECCLYTIHMQEKDY